MTGDPTSTAPFSQAPGSRVGAGIARDLGVSPAPIPAVKTAPGRPEDRIPGTAAIGRPLRAALLASIMILSVLPMIGGPEETRPDAGAPEDEEERLLLLRRDIDTLRDGIEKLSGAEKGLLGELKTLEADSMRRQAGLADALERIRSAKKEETAAETRAREAQERTEELKGRVAKRLAALYRMGRPRYLRIFLASERAGDLLSAWRTAESISSRDAALMTKYREETDRARIEAHRLQALRDRLQTVKADRERSAAEVRAALERKRTLLDRIQGERETHQSALGELEAAEIALGRIVAGLPGEESAPIPPVGFKTFRGLLDWPAEGPVSAPFGRAVNKKFGTSLVHGGLDIDAPFGSAIRSIQDGSVALAQWLRGYGLTVIVDHGEGWMSVYSHASALLVQKGETVRRGDKIATVGDSGSLRGAYLYFEIRKDGKPIDPAGWLRPR